jgi:hypothetical protein
MTFSSQAGLASFAALAVSVPTIEPLVFPTILADDAITTVPVMELAA